MSKERHIEIFKEIREFISKYDGERSSVMMMAILEVTLSIAVETGININSFKRELGKMIAIYELSADISELTSKATNDR